MDLLSYALSIPALGPHEVQVAADQAFVTRCPIATSFPSCLYGQDDAGGSAELDMVLRLPPTSYVQTAVAGFSSSGRTGENTPDGAIDAG